MITLIDIALTVLLTALFALMAATPMIVGASNPHPAKPQVVQVESRVSRTLHGHDLDAV